MTDIAPKQPPEATASLDDWLAWMTTWHPLEMDLGLERAALIYQHSQFSHKNIPVILVGGTNGKGSVTAYLEAILTEAGYRTGVYRSPHLLKFNERIRIAARDLSDIEITQAFSETVALAQTLETTLSYFEITTLGALAAFAQDSVDIAILEVGLGGRLDATNVTDPLVSVITNIGLDHTEWLGETRGEIAHEKAHIFRAQRYGICGDYQPPKTITEYAEKIGVKLQLINQDFSIIAQDSTLCYQSGQHAELILPMPNLSGEYQQDNLACAMRVIEVLQSEGFAFSTVSIEKGIETATLAGRLQRIQAYGKTWLFDVAHNPAAAQQLAKFLEKTYSNQGIDAIFGVMIDKNIAEIVRAVAPFISRWHLVRPNISRAIDVDALYAIMQDSLSRMRLDASLASCSSVAHAMQIVADAKATDDASNIVLVFGSFYTVGEALRFFEGTEL